MWPFGRTQAKFSDPQVQDQAEAIRKAWAEAHRQAEAGRSMGLHIQFKRRGLGDPSTSPLDFEAGLKIYRSEEL